MVEALIHGLKQIFTWVIIVAPWEQALRVRLGKKVTLLHPGLYFKVPFIDRIYRQSVRLRMSIIRAQVLTTSDGHAVSVAGSVGYKIDNLETLYNSLDSIESTLELFVSGFISDFITTHTLKECKPGSVVEAVKEALDFEKYGLAECEFCLMSFACVKTYRFITGDLPDWEKIGDLLNHIE